MSACVFVEARELRKLSPLVTYIFNVRLHSFKHLRQFKYAVMSVLVAVVGRVELEGAGLEGAGLADGGNDRQEKAREDGEEGDEIMEDTNGEAIGVNIKEIIVK